jgi:nucleotide-binding universal stress UspA family protein
MTPTETNCGDPATPAQELFGDALCAIDGTPASLAAVEHAAALAGPAGELTLLLVTSYRAEGERRSPAIGPLRAKEMLDRAVKIVHEAGITPTVEVDPASPPARVVQAWAAGRRLLAMGAPATSWFAGTFFGGVVATAENALSTPLLTAHAGQPGDIYRGPILIASDGLEESDALVELGGRLAHSRGVRAVLLHAVGAESHAQPHRMEQQAASLERITDGACDVHVEPGSARTLVPETASAVGASLILMSTRRLRGLASIGSVSRRVVHHGDRSVLLVPPEQLLGAQF